MEIENMNNKFYVYRFINKDENIVYVGKTIDLKTRFRQHEYLTDDIIKIEYIECASEADMTWKEIYYINLYKNKDTTNNTIGYSQNIIDVDDIKLKKDIINASNAIKDIK